MRKLVVVGVFLIAFSGPALADDPPSAPPNRSAASQPESDSFKTQLGAKIDQNEVQDQQRASAIKRQLDETQAGLTKFEHDELEKLEAITSQALDAEKAAKSPSWWPLVGAIIGALISSLIAGSIAMWVARRITLRIKMIESVLEFSKRFGELVQKQADLNKVYKEARKNADYPATAIELAEANFWWTRFFDLVLYEFDFFKQGLIWDERFAQWMKWRWHEFNAQGDDIWKTNGVDYQTGWRNWKNLPANDGHRLIPFLDGIHHARDPAAVVSLVRAASPKYWHRYHLER